MVITIFSVSLKVFTSFDSYNDIGCQLDLGGWLFDMLGISWGGILGQLGTAIIGAVVILWIASLIKK